MTEKKSLGEECFAELLGTAILVFFGIGVVHVGVLTGTVIGLWQTAVVWGLAVMLAIYVVGAISGAHLNPAVTIALAIFGGFPLRKVVPYAVAQLAGAIIAAIILYFLFSGALVTYEQANNIVRGEPRSELSAMVYCEYFPNPAVREANKWPDEVISMPQAMLTEIIGTAFLLLMIMALTDPNNKGNAGTYLAPLFIGLTIALCISICAPVTQGCFNPARDLGPRIVAWLAGWRTIAFPGPRGGFFTVYILAPIIGGLVGGALYKWCIAPVYSAGSSEQSMSLPVMERE